MRQKPEFWLRGTFWQTMRMSEETYNAMLKLYGLDKPWYTRYFIWLKRLATFDFGNSFLELFLPDDCIVHKDLVIKSNSRTMASVFCAPQKVLCTAARIKTIDP